MTLSQLKSHLAGMESLDFQLPDGTSVPAHIHVTEIGEVTRRFIDCGGKLRETKAINFQLWEDGDFDHRLAPTKLRDIIALAEERLHLADGEIEVEYQGDTISSYGLEADGTTLRLTRRQTDCLAKDKCVPASAKPRIRISDLGSASGCCTPSSGCC